MLLEEAMNVSSLETQSTNLFSKYETGFEWLLSKFHSPLFLMLQANASSGQNKIAINSNYAGKTN